MSDPAASSPATSSASTPSDAGASGAPYRAWPSNTELEAWRRAADDLLREHPVHGPTVRNAAFLLQNAYLTVSAAKSASAPRAEVPPMPDGAEAARRDEVKTLRLALWRAICEAWVQRGELPAGATLVAP